MALSEYKDMADFQEALENEGLVYYFVNCNDASNVRIVGQPLPEGIVEAARDLERAVDILQKWTGVQSL
jgi:hypothetical protein